MTNNIIVLCHKCSGTLEGRQEPLYRCDCLSGYVRGFEDNLNLDEALTEQRNAVAQVLDLYRRQRRDEQGRHIQEMLKRQAKLA